MVLFLELETQNSNILTFPKHSKGVKYKSATMRVFRAEALAMYNLTENVENESPCLSLARVNVKRRAGRLQVGSVATGDWLFKIF